MKNKKVSSRHRPQIYNDEFKWKVVQEVLSGKITQAEAKRKYNIKSVVLNTTATTCTSVKFK